MLETPHRPGPGSPIGALQSESYFLPALILQVSEQHCDLRVSAHTCFCLLHLSQLLTPVNSTLLSSPLLRGPKLTPLAVLIIQEHFFLQWSHPNRSLSSPVYAGKNSIKKRKCQNPMQMLVLSMCTTGAHGAIRTRPTSGTRGWPLSVEAPDPEFLAHLLLPHMRWS